MGEYFSYANLDRKEYFSIGLFAGGIKRSCIGGGWGARALGLLLTPDIYASRDQPEGALEQGSWAGQRVVVVGDETMYGKISRSLSDGSCDTIEELFDDFREIDSRVLLMLLRDDYPDRIEEWARENEYIFLAFAELASVHHVPEAIEFVSKVFGDGWQEQYGELRKTNHLRVPPP